MDVCSACGRSTATVQHRRGADKPICRECTKKVREKHALKTAVRESARTRLGPRVHRP